MIAATPAQTTALTTALILCGGGATRLGGIDKSLRDCAGKLLIARVLDRVAPQVTHIVISANRNFDRYERYTPTTVDDAAFAGGGPLAGFLAGLEAAITEDVLCVPGDAPLLPDDLLSRLAQARLQLSDAAIAYAHDGRGPQPLCCLLQRNLRDDLRMYLHDGGRTPREWFQRHRTAVADFSDSPDWAWSLNTEPQWLAVEQQFKQIERA